MSAARLDSMIIRARLLAPLMLAMLVAAPAASRAQEDDVTVDGLVRVKDAQVAAAYVLPEADFSVYSRLLLLEPGVAFVRNWQRDQNRGRMGSRRITERDMEAIKEDVAELFDDVFREVLTDKDGYEIVGAPADDVLLIRPAIIDLDITAPDMDMRTAGRARTFSTRTGQATIIIELYDSVTGQVLARAADRKEARGAGAGIQWNRADRVSNRADGRRLMRGWAEQLRGFLDRNLTQPAE